MAQTLGMAAGTGTTRTEGRGVGHALAAFFAAAVGLVTIAGHAAIALNGWPRWISLIGFVAMVGVMGWLGWLLYCWHAEKGRYEPPPMAPPFAEYL